MENRITITNEFNPLFGEHIPVARFRTCEAHLLEQPHKREINIQYIKSEEQGKGDAQGLVLGLIEYCKGKGAVLSSSQPISDAWEHICEKYQIKVYRMDV